MRDLLTDAIDAYVRDRDKRWLLLDDRVDEAFREWRCLPWWKRLWYLVVSAW